ncbi:uncharacterized protein LOC115750451 [Rhodamnia argentea]|uniref:Uncharacterized protein LOC115750451 n=1 Tax=Rhodamnia argentea TaxID=178133 RepID=A0ABM3GUY9_9MYRT|nr:uncharacterized protein LOC115750451 [Rhodamnia argentea]
MDQDRSELRSLGFLGVYGETSKIVLKWRKIFAQIVLALVLPLCAIYLAHSLVSQLLASKIFDHETTRNDTRYDDPRYGDLSRRLKREWVAFWLVRLGYFILAFVFSLLSTSAVASAVATIYAAAEQVTFKEVMRVVPRTWKRLAVTFIWSFVIFFVYNVVVVGLLIVWVVVVRRSSVGAALGIAVAVVLLILCVIGFVYITMIWQLASVISVLEDVYGRKAMVKSKRLIKGKMGVSVGCFLGVLLCSVLVLALFEGLVVLDLVDGIGIKIGVGLICLLLLLMVVLFDLVVQTVIYFVCKSYHHENIDKSSLSDHLEVYLGDYVPLKANSIQLDQLHV